MYRNFKSLREIAYFREFLQWFYRAEEVQNYEEGEIEGKKGENDGIKDCAISMNQELFQNLFPQESSDFLKNCSVDQLDHIFKLLLKKPALQELHIYLNEERGGQY